MTEYKEEEYPAWGDERMHPQMWECTRQEDSGNAWEDHWIWTGTPKVTRGHPQHGAFMRLHPARLYWPKKHGMRFERVCKNYECVNPRHYDPMKHEYQQTPLNSLEELGGVENLPDLDWYLEGLAELEGDA